MLTYGGSTSLDEVYQMNSIATKTLKLYVVLQFFYDIGRSYENKAAVSF